MQTTQRLRALGLAITAAAAAALGCSGGPHHAATADLGPSAATVTPPVVPRAATDHPQLWHVTSRGTSQTAPRVYTVIWPGSEAIGQKVEQFISWMLTSDYFTGALAEYGVGAGQSMGLIVLPTAAPPTLLDSDLRALVTQLLQSGQVDPRDDDNTQIAFILPQTTVVTLDGDSTCTEIAGYHDSPSTSLPVVAYDVIADCDASPTELDSLTRILSHEISEAATDPESGLGYSDDSPKGQEISDLCNFSENLPIDVPGNPPLRYWVQRQYSNRAALAGNEEPCQPLPWARPYWGVALYPREQTIAASQTPKTVRAWIEPFAYGDVGTIAWQLLSVDSGVTAEPSSGVAQAGDTIPIEVTISAPMAGQSYELDLESESAKAGSSLWFSYIIIQ